MYESKCCHILWYLKICQHFLKSMLAKLRKISKMYNIGKFRHMWSVIVMIYVVGVTALRQVLRECSNMKLRRALWKAPGERPMGRDCVDTRFSMAWNKKEVNCCILWFPVIYLTCKYNVGGGYRTPKKPSVGEAKTSRRVSVKYKLSRISFEKQKEVF